MKTTVYFSDFCDSFTKADRTNQFSYNGLRIIYDYLIEVEESCGSEFELDVIGICCDFAEGHWSDVADYYSNMIEINKSASESEQETQLLDFLADQEVLIGSHNNGVVYRQF